MGKSQFQLTAELLLHPNAKSVRNTFNFINKKLRKAAVIHPDIRINKRTSNQLRAMEARLRGISKQAANTSSNFQKMGSSGGLTKVTRQLNKATRSSKSFAHATHLATRRYAAWIVGSGTSWLGARGFISGIKESVKFENSLVVLAQVSGTALKSMRPLGKEVRKIGQEFGVASSEIISALVSLRQAGFEDVGKFAPLLAKARRGPSFGNLENVSNAIILLKEAFHLKGINEYTQAMSNLNTLSKAYSVESEDLVVALSKAGGAYSNLSKDVGEFLVLMTVLRSVTREEAGPLAISLRTSVARLTRKSNIELARKELGVNLLSDEGGALSPFESFRRLAAAKQQAQTPKQQLKFGQTLEKMFGLRQISRITSLLNSWQMAEEALLIARKNQDSLTKDAAIAQDALSVKYTKTTEAISTQFDALIASSPFRKITGESLEFTQQIVKMTSALSSLLPLLALMGGTKLTSMMYMAGHLPGGRQPMSAFGYGKTSRIGGRPRMQVARAAIGRTMGRIGPAGPIGLALGANYLASQSPNNAGLQAAASGLTTGVIVGMFNPLLGGIAGVVMALKTFSESTIRAARSADDLRFRNQQDKLGLSIKSGGLLSGSAIENFRSSVNTLRYNEGQNTISKIGNWAGYWRAVGTLKSPQDAKGEIQQEEKERLRGQRNVLGQTAIALRDEIAGKVKNMKEFNEFGNGLGRLVIELGTKIDRDFVKPLIETLGKQAKQVQAASVYSQTGQMTVAHTALQNWLALPNLVRGFSATPLNLSADLANLGTQKFGKTAQMFGQPLLGQVNKAHNFLPQLLSQSGFTQENFKDVILDSIDSDAIRKSVEDKLSTLEFEQFRKGLSNVHGMSKNLLSGFDSLVGSARKSASVIDAYSQRLISNLQNVFNAKTQFYNAISNVDALQLTRAKTREQFNMSRVRGNAANRLIQFQAKDFAGTANVNQLQNQLSFHRQKFQQTGDPKHIIAIKLATAALSKLANMSGRTSTMMEKLSRIQREKASRENLAQNILTASPLGRMRMGQDLMGALRAQAQGGFFGNFIQNTQAMQGLDLLGDRGQKIKSRLLAKTLPGLLGGVNKQEKQTQNQVLNIQRDSIAASQAIADHLKIQAGMMDRQTNQMKDLSEALREFNISLPESIELQARHEIYIHGGEFVQEAKDVFTQIAQQETIRQIHKYINPTTGETLPQG